MQEVKERKRKYGISLLIMVLLVGITFWIFLKDNDPKQLWNVVRNADPKYILLGIGAMLGFVACEAISIKIILRSLGQKLPFLRSYKYAFVAFYYSSITPSGSGGQPMQLYHMKKDRINLSHGSLTILILVSVYQIAELAFALLVFGFQSEFVLAHVKGISVLLIYGIVFNLVVLTLILSAIFSKKLVSRILIWGTGVLGKLRLLRHPQQTLETVQEQIREYQQGAEHIRSHPMVMAKVLIVTMLQLFCQFLVPFFVYRAFGLSEYNVMQIVAVQAMLTLAVGSLPIPGAVGASESGFMVLFRIFFSSAQLLPAMMLSRGISFYGMLLISGGVALFATMQMPSFPLKKVKCQMLSTSKEQVEG